MKVLTVEEFKPDEHPLLLGTPEGLRWYDPERTLPPRAAPATYSPNLWLALSDGRVVRGYTAFWSAPKTENYRFHSWCYYENAYGGLIPREIRWTPNVKMVEAWSLVVEPVHPIRGT